MRGCLQGRVLSGFVFVECVFPWNKVGRYAVTAEMFVGILFSGKSQTKHFRRLLWLR